MLTAKTTGSGSGGSLASDPSQRPEAAAPPGSAGTGGPQVLSSLHADYIYQMAFDTYGRRMATCGGDRSVRVWDLGDNGDWTLTGQWQAHRGAVLALAWAHPEYGSLLATAGSDQEAKIWEERTAGGGGGGSGAAGSAAGAAPTARWNLKASLTEARRSVTCLEFAPRHLGLKLAVGSADGCVRIYEAVDINNLAQWPLAATLECFAETAAHKLGCTALAWCTGRFEPPTLVAGGGAHCVVYRYADAARAWEPLLPLRLPEAAAAVGGAALPPPRPVLDVAWAPNVGRRFHYIASAEGAQLKIYKLRRGAADDGGAEAAGAEAPAAPTSALTLESVQVIQENAWRCQWNVTGTVLASSGDGGVVQLWKANGEGQFECVGTVQSSVPAE